MGKAKKLPSGNYRVREYDYTDEAGKKHYKSFTHSDKRTAELMAKEFKAGKRIKVNDEECTFLLESAYDKYIELKEYVLSPTTIREYKKYKKTYFQNLMKKNIFEISQEDVQNAVNSEIVDRSISPKTIHNIHGLLSSVLKEYRPEFALRTTLPKKQKTEINIPSKEEVLTLLKHIEDTPLELPVLLCSGLGLRRSEVCALTWKDIDFDNHTLKINKALVQNDKKEWILKIPKTPSSNRVLDIPDYIFKVLKKQKKEQGSIAEFNPNVFYKRYKKVLEELQLPGYRLHDLRHYTASVMLALNVPNKYAMEIMGHETENMLNRVYQHTMKSEMKKISSKLDLYHNKI